MEIIIASICAFIIIILSFFLIIKELKVRKIKETLKQKEGNTEDLFKRIDKLSSQKNDFYNRIVELENIKGEAFQVRLRNEIVEVNVDFTKIEIVTMLAGVNILLERTKDPEDEKIYVNLIEKINGFINDMKE